MSGDWDTPVTFSEAKNLDVDGVLKDTTNIASNEQSEVAFDPQARGWVKPVAFNYNAYNRATSALENGGAEITTTSGDENGASFEGPKWASNAKRYEWSEEHGDIAPRIDELEQELFHGEFRNRAGPKIEALELTVEVESEEKVDPVIKFEDAGLHPVIMENVVLCGYNRPTPIQAYTIPSILTGHDLIAVAQTGSGKTAAFLIPILSKLMGKAKKLAAARPNPVQDFDPRVHGVTAEPLVLVIVPTRELAVQIFDEARRLCYRSMLRPCVVYGGGPVKDQWRELSKGCDILVGTPGRLIDFMTRGNIMSLRRVRYTVIDEADEMVSPDWQEDLGTLLSGGDNNEDADHRYLMFSATFPQEAQDLAKEYLDDSHIRIKVGRVGSTHANIFQHLVFASQDKKRECLRDLLRSTDPIRTIIFVNSKGAADEVDDYLYNQGFPSTSIHADRTQREREDALEAFRTGKCPLLVTTGVTARGLDVYDVGHVINFDLPRIDHGGINEYIHRIGRTARIGHVGVATSLYNEHDDGIAEDLVKLLIETDQVVPDFLEDFKPREGEEAESAEEQVSGDNAAGGDGWGSTEEVNAGW